ncbi:AbrB/MazE/SpoVT family DNA-binding domain-containing protein [Chromatiaceae bacterium AAb-1]|jgi:antitoxin ChpS|nr:AbrB/MazE/SpoVT family DNA-binding domain-containing protein [Chromatiaceae bacterium AAb-1]
MLTHVRKIGNSAGTIIPAQMMKALNLKEGDALSIEEQEGKIVISPAKTRPKYKLEDLLAQCDPNAPMPEELIEWERTAPVGKEIL